MQKKYVKSVVGITLFVGKVDLDENYILIYIMSISERNTIVISSTTVLNLMSGL